MTALSPLPDPAWCDPDGGWIVPLDAIEAALREFGERWTQPRATDEWTLIALHRAAEVWVFMRLGGAVDFEVGVRLERGGVHGERSRVWIEARRDGLTIADVRLRAWWGDA